MEGAGMTETTTYVTAQLAPREMVQGAFVGMMRQVSKIQKGSRGRYGIDNDEFGWQAAIEGCLGEMVVAAYLNVYWAGAAYDTPDVAGWLEVKTRRSHDFELTLHKQSRDDLPFVLVTGANGSYRIHGWIYGRDGKRPEYWKDPSGDSGKRKRPAFFVPQKALLPLEELPIPGGVQCGS